MCFTGKYLDCCDSVDFALGLRDYDLSLLQPHFPGYPVYIFISRLLFKFFPDEVWALILPGVFFGSLTVYPLSFLARQLFSERVAILTAILYLINPLCWLQAERPTSDAMGLFFIMLSAYFLYRAFNSMVRNFTVKGWHGQTCLSMSNSKNSINNPSFYLEKKGSIFTPDDAPKNHGWCSDRNCLFLGSLTLGFGLGVRLSYFPFIALLIGILFYLVIQRMPLKIRVILYGLTGFVAGVCSWFFPQIEYLGWRPFLQNGLSFSHGHFTDW
ncbi:MAG: glycosyltransferase family 39 protein, partial [Candidatus Brocadiaceae bacterium]